ncbi:hypothetical protein SAMN05421504_109198 [Amycolatopsis xylanica]|uniref:Uncharacterized protein n=1 Tax=Amycolatopsis xylanica TaxID=589385 RepID=A0A1H3QAA5_9PSEU|nr:hypothetical protein [Amycolatopsis xylanica]SDZ10081.1 hypothetical protein SAMN05421504_109198 [Amycolatopsis xylanica]
MSRLTDEQAEALLRHGLDQIASRAPDAGHVRERLARRARPRPVARLVAVAAAVVVVAAGVPLGIKLLPQDQAQEQVRAPVAAGWLPDGFTEQAGGENTRLWRSGAAEIELTIHGTDEREWSANAVRIARLQSQILIKGRVAEFTEEASTAVLTWLPDEAHVLQLRLTGVPEARPMALRIADAVQFP